MTDHYLAGLDVLERTGGGMDLHRNRVAEVAPDFVRIAIGFTYGEIFARPGLDLRTREIAAVAAYAALGNAMAQLRAHVAAALHLGWGRTEIIEVLMQTAVHAGMPVALNALSECHDLLVEGGAYCMPCRGDPAGDGQS